MASSHRGGALAGEDIILRAVFTDAAGCLQDLDSVPQIYIYDEDVEKSTIQAEAAAQVYTTALAGPLAATRLSAGYYTYTYAVPAGSDAGTWHDLWAGTINTVDDYEIFDFKVSSGFDAESQNLANNMMVVVQLKNAITNSDGDESLVATDLYYTTVYSPLYASPDLVRLEMGRWIDYIPDDTLALMAHLSSKTANFIQGDIPINNKHLQLARTRFVTFDTVWRCLNMPGQGKQAGYSSGKKKSLGDLSIADGSPVVDIPDEIYEYVREERAAWWRVVNAGGNIVPGQGLNPTFAVKGWQDPDRRLTGRLWDSPDRYNYAQPTANRKIRHAKMRRGRFNFRGGGSGT